MEHVIHICPPGFFRPAQKCPRGQFGCLGERPCEFHYRNCLAASGAGHKATARWPEDKRWTRSSSTKSSRAAGDLATWRPGGWWGAKRDSRVGPEWARARGNEHLGRRPELAIICHCVRRSGELADRRTRTYAGARLRRLADPQPPPIPSRAPRRKWAHGRTVSIIAPAHLLAGLMILAAPILLAT